MNELTAEQEKGFVEAVFAYWQGYVDAYELEFKDAPDERKAKRYFLAGVRWAQEQKR